LQQCNVVSYVSVQIVERGINYTPVERHGLRIAFCKTVSRFAHFKSLFVRVEDTSNMAASFWHQFSDVASSRVLTVDGLCR